MPASDIDVAVERKPGSLVELRVTAPPEEVDRAIDASLRRLASRVRIPGFRPGKAPGPMVERAVGWDAVRHEAVDQLVPDLYRRALEQGGVEPVADPELSVDTHALERDKPLTFTATVTVKPDVELGDYRSLRVERETTEITDERVEEALEAVRRRHAALQEVERPAQNGDVLRATVRMRRGDEVIAGEDENERDLELDRDSVIPAIVDGIIGLKAGESRSFEVTLPDNYPREELRNTTVTMDVTVHAVRERELPPLDDALAAQEQHATVAEMRDHLREQLVKRAEVDDQERFEERALTGLRESARVDVPQVMVDQEIDRQLTDLEYRLASVGLPLERYVEMSGQSMDQLRGERREAAQQRVRLDLALDALADAEGIEVDEDQVRREAQRIAEGRKLSASQRRRLEDIARRDLLRRAAAFRLLEIVDAGEFVQT